MQYEIELTFTEDVLGGAPQDKELYTNYIADKRADMNGDILAEELATLREDKGKTGFHRLEDGTPIFYDYVVRGFFKDACGMLSRVQDSESKKVKAYKKIIDGLVFVFPRKIPIQVVGEMGVLERPLRAQTAQGERVALAYSECIPAGSHMRFTLEVLDDKAVSEELLREWFDYGRLRGLGQWRNGSYGRYSYTLKAK